MAFKEILLAALAITSTAVAVYMFQGGQLPERAQSSSFMAFNRRYGKTHASQQELEYRYAIYLDNLRFIAAKNAEQNSFTVGENQYADLSFEEFKNKYLSQEVLPNRVFGIAGEPVQVAGTKDWRDEGKVTPVKNQAACGSCWAFSATGSLEGVYAIKNNELKDFSDMELVNCSRGYGNNGCNGGLMSYAYDYIIDNQIGLTADYPYRPVDGRCNVPKDKDRTSITGYHGLEPTNVNGLLAAIDLSPVAVALEVMRDFQLYTGGIYKGSRSCGSGLNHGVTAVGYSDQEGGYFIVKNSWGTGWGEKGIIRMAIGTGSGTCGIANDYDAVPEL